MDSSTRGATGEYSPMGDNHGTVATEEKKEHTFESAMNAMVYTGPLNILLVCVPIGMASYYLGWSDILTFSFSLLGLAPLAERLGFVTEQLAIHTNETIGGLLNATFGNLTELIVAVTALNRGLFRLVQLSLLGSVLSNMLLVLGTAFAFGGYYHKTQSFGTISSQMNATLLIVSTMAVLFPTVLTLSGEESSLGQLGFSRATSLILFLVYFAFIYFQLVTHKFLYEERPKVEGADDEEKALVVKSPITPDTVNPPLGVVARTASGDYEREHPVGSLPFKRPSLSKELSLSSIKSEKSVASGAGSGRGSTDADHLRKSPGPSGMILEADEESRGKESSVGEDGVGVVAGGDGDKDGGEEEEDDDDDDEEEDLLGFNYAMVWLGIITVFIAILSDAISGSIQDAADSAGISGIFIASIILPIVGNAAEHAGAVMFAVKGKLDLSLGVAIGSSTQIALCVLPLIVIIGWILDKDMDLNFGAYESATMFLSVIAVTFSIKDGHSNWLLGVTLIAAYLVVSVGFYAHINDKLD